jgi:hypothetical protein
MRCRECGVSRAGGPCLTPEVPEARRRKGCRRPRCLVQYHCGVMAAASVGRSVVVVGSRRGHQYVGDSPHIMIILLMRVNHFIYTMYNIYTIYTH